MAITTNALFTPIKVGNMQLQHRIAMAPLTRFRNDDEHAHTGPGLEYYTQRCDVPGTLIITEATFISPQAGGYPNGPGIYSENQIAAWKKIVDAVHAKGCFMVLQLWALGRATDEAFLKTEGEYEVVSASDIPFEGGATPRPLTVPEIKEYVAWYAQGAKNFIERCGGDGVEIHGANGYLIDQFTQTISNHRTDNYGGSVENRTRFGLEVVAAVVAAVGPTKVGIRLTPFSPWQGMKMPLADIKETFTYLVSHIKAAHPTMMWIHCVEGRLAGIADVEALEGEDLDFLHELWTPNTFLVAGGFTSASARESANHRANSVIVFGRAFIANPDLVKKIKYEVAFTPYDRKSFYLYGPDKVQGYTDYPFDPELINKA